MENYARLKSLPELWLMIYFADYIPNIPYIPADTNIIELWQPFKSFYRYPSYMKAGPLGNTCPRLTWPKGGHLHQRSFLIHLTTSHSQWPPSLAMTHAGSDEPAWSQLVLSRFSQQLLQAHFPEKHLTLPLPLTWLSYSVIISLSFLNLGVDIFRLPMSETCCKLLV